MAGAPDAADLLDDPAPFEAVVDGTEPGPLAIVGAPYAGRERVLDAAAERLDAARVRLQPGDGAGPVRDALDNSADGRAADGRPLVVDDCQHLYTRAVGGFEPLEAFLDLLAGTERTVVTGWNRFAWAYLITVRVVEPVFAETAELGAVGADRLAELVLARYESLPAFEPDEAVPAGPVSVRRHEVEIGGRTLSVPVPVPNLGGTWTTDADAEADPRDLVFERLAAAADGNVGVASAIWERYRHDTIRPSDIAVPGTDLELDRDEAFCLRVVLAKERLPRSELDAVLDSNPDRVLARLRRAGVVSVADGEVRLDPAAVPTAVDSTDRERIP